MAIIFFASCALGLQQFTYQKALILAVVVTGCSLCATGEPLDAGTAGPRP